MTPEDQAQASKLIDLLRAKGVRSWKGFGIELELAAPESAMPVADKTDSGLCQCGHRDYEHQGGLCIAGGCDPTKCAPEAK